MNSLTVTRPLPLHSQWKCLSAAITGGNSSSQSLSPVNIQPLRLGQKSCKQVLVFSENCRPHGCTFVPSQYFHTAGRVSVEHKLKTGIKDCYSLLGVEQDCADQELKDAYLEKAKAFHPDSASGTADPYMFSQVKDAYKAVLEHRKGRELKKEEEEEAEIIFDIKHTAAQHRQYLEFEGVGFGTPSQRQRQYQQYRVARVTENVFQHRMQKQAAQVEDALVVKDKQQARKIKISNALERMVEDLIQESMKRGDFNDLPGQGKPLSHSDHNPFVDTTTHNLNKILVNNGFAPEWIMLQSDIRKEINQARQTLAVIRSKVGEQPCSAHHAKMWRASLIKFKQQVSEVNTKINKYNLIVPLLNKQKMPYNAEREVKKVLDNVEDYLPEEGSSSPAWDVSVQEMPPSSPQETIDWKQLWQDIKKVFTMSQDKRS